MRWEAGGHHGGMGQTVREELIDPLTNLWLDRCGSQAERDSCRPDATELVDRAINEALTEKRS